MAADIVFLWDLVDLAMDGLGVPPSSEPRSRLTTALEASIKDAYGRNMTFTNGLGTCQAHRDRGAYNWKGIAQQG